jgi:hypothetical protein
MHAGADQPTEIWIRFRFPTAFMMTDSPRPDINATTSRYDSTMQRIGREYDQQ